MFVKVLRLDTARADEMEVDGAPDLREEGSSSRASSVAAGLPAPWGKRKRAACSSGADGGSASRGQVDNAVQLPKRRVLAWMRPHQWLPAGFGGLFAAPRELPVSRSHRARVVAKAMSRVRRRIGKPTRRRQQHQQSLGQHLSRISL
ncbi:hypothetical protein PAHAL_5G485400 [Panicum hallii]|uniref:Uncharacterized protein n=2 Tax=Panicum hallii TaxID=206008 RepID=A0A2T8INV9_9POAL|nr:hypothetical protein PAHAL_5G485400 [Panicum hallii]